MFRKKKFKSNASSIGVIGSIDGPTAIFIASKDIEKYKFSPIKRKRFLIKGLDLIRNNDK